MCANDGQHADSFLSLERLPELKPPLPVKFEFSRAQQQILFASVPTSEAKQWVIYDAAGKWLLEGMVSANEHISVQHLLPGVYHMVIQDTRGTSIAAHRF